MEEYVDLCETKKQKIIFTTRYYKLQHFNLIQYKYGRLSYI